MTRHTVYNLIEKKKNNMSGYGCDVDVANNKIETYQKINN